MQIAARFMFFGSIFHFFAWSTIAICIPEQMFFVTSAPFVIVGLFLSLFYYSLFGFQRPLVSPNIGWAITGLLNFGVFLVLGCVVSIQEKGHTSLLLSYLWFCLLWNLTVCVISCSQLKRKA